MMQKSKERKLALLGSGAFGFTEYLQHLPNRSCDIIGERRRLRDHFRPDMTTNPHG